MLCTGQPLEHRAGEKTGTGKGGSRRIQAAAAQGTKSFSVPPGHGVHSLPEPGRAAKGGEQDGSPNLSVLCSDSVGAMPRITPHANLHQLLQVLLDPLGHKPQVARRFVL